MVTTATAVEADIESTAQSPDSPETASSRGAVTSAMAAVHRQTACTLCSVLRQDQICDKLIVVEQRGPGSSQRGGAAAQNAAGSTSKGGAAANGATKGTNFQTGGDQVAEAPEQGIGGAADEEAAERRIDIGPHIEVLCAKTLPLSSRRMKVKDDKLKPQRLGLVLSE